MNKLMSLLNLLKKYLPLILILTFSIFCWRWFEFANKSQFDLAEPIIDGVIGGIVTSMIILIFTVVWQSSITPWVENLLYRDTKIEGIWSGILVPFVGIDEIDKRRIKVAFGVIERRRRKRVAGNNEDKAVNKPSFAIAAREINGEIDKDIEAELIIKDAPPIEQDGVQDELIDRRFVLKIGAGMSPIEVRVEIKRVGHSIRGHIVEIGGASDIHTYFF